MTESTYSSEITDRVASAILAFSIFFSICGLFSSTYLSYSDSIVVIAYLHLTFWSKDCQYCKSLVKAWFWTIFVLISVWNVRRSAMDMVLRCSSASFSRSSSGKRRSSKANSYLECLFLKLTIFSSCMNPSWFYSCANFRSKTTVHKAF